MSRQTGIASQHMVCAFDEMTMQRCRRIHEKEVSGAQVRAEAALHVSGFISPYRT